MSLGNYGPREVRSWARQAENRGWRVREGRKHFVFFPPDEQADPVVVGHTCGGGRGRANAVAALRRNGLRVA